MFKRQQYHSSNMLFFLLKNILSSFYFLGLFKINNTSTFMVCFSSGFSFLFHLHLINFLFRFSSCSSFSLLLLIIGLPLRCCCFFLFSLRTTWVFFFWDFLLISFFSFFVCGKFYKNSLNSFKKHRKQRNVEREKNIKNFIYYII